ncbi:MAG: hypothetical protein ABW321_10690 [Polyangiales bacterium]
MTRSLRWLWVVALLLQGVSRGAAAQDEVSDAGSTPADEPPGGDDSAADGVGLGLQVHAGAGVGRRALTWPRAGEVLRVQTGTFAALDVGVAWPLSWTRALSLGPAFVYQTSLGREVEERHITGPPDVLRIRAHRFEAVLDAVFGAASSPFRLGVALGYVTNNLRAEVHHLGTPSYSLAGPLARLSGRIALGSAVSLWVAPEVQWVLVGDDLEERGVGATGWGLGGEVVLEVALATKLLLALAVRDTHIWLTAAEPGEALDHGQFATLRMVYRP